MTDVMHRCVPLSTGELSPDVRVNYQFGLVLGVDEFEQESLYFRERDERATRTLHGYGTAVGLHVTATRPLSAPKDVEVHVERGVAYDQWGRPVVVRTDQCALVGAWLAGQEHEAAQRNEPSPMALHGHPSGDLTLYVVAAAAECEDALVPLPGNPCASDEDSMAASRIRDSWQLELRWEPPEMPAWDGVRALADILAGVDVQEGSPLSSDEDVLAAHIRALAPGAPPPPMPLPSAPALPALEARAALDRLLTIWVTEVRPRLAPDLIQPPDESAPPGHPARDPAVLLTTITVAPDDAFDTNAPVIVAFSDPDDEGRPYLAPTALIQELVALGGGGVATILAGSPVEKVIVRTPVQLASIIEQGDTFSKQILLWSNIGLPLVLPATVNVRRNGGAVVAFRTSPGPRPEFTLLTPPAGAPVRDREQLEVLIDLNEVRVRDTAAGTEESVARWFDRKGLEVVDQRGTEVVIRHVTTVTPPRPTAIPDPPPPTRLRPVRELVTATWTRTEDGRFDGIEMWFHVDKNASDDVERVVEFPSEAMQVLAEVEPDPTPRDVPFEIFQVQHNVFMLAIDSGAVEDTRYLRVVTRLDRIGLENGRSLLDWGEALEVIFEGIDPDEGTHVSYVRIPRARG